MHEKCKLTSVSVGVSILDIKWRAVHLHVIVYISLMLMCLKYALQVMVMVNSIFRHGNCP